MQVSFQGCGWERRVMERKVYKLIVQLNDLHNLCCVTGWLHIRYIVIICESHIHNGATWEGAIAPWFSTSFACRLQLVNHNIKVEVCN